jgi:hypothetical protein
MTWYESPVPCEMCHKTYSLPKPYEECQVLIRDYCFDCYCLKMDKIHTMKEESDMAAEEERKMREE